LVRKPSAPASSSPRSFATGRSNPALAALQSVYGWFFQLSRSCRSILLPTVNMRTGRRDGQLARIQSGSRPEHGELACIV